MSQSKVTPVGRASFPHLDTPNTFGKYAITILLPKSDPKVKSFVAWLGEAVHSEALAIAGEKGMQSAMTDFLAFKDGDNTELFKTPRAEYAGHWVLSASRKQEHGKPTTVNRHRKSIDPTEIYSGCDVLAYIDVFGYKYGTKKSVSIGVQHIMKVGDNTPFASGGMTADMAFSDIEIPAEDKTKGIPGTADNPFGGGAVPGVKKDAYNPFLGV